MLGLQRTRPTRCSNRNTSKKPFALIGRGSQEAGAATYKRQTPYAKGSLLACSFTPTRKEKNVGRALEQTGGGVTRSSCPGSLSSLPLGHLLDQTQGR